MNKPQPIFIELDVDYDYDSRIIEAGSLAELLYIRCLCACKKLAVSQLSRRQIERFGYGVCDPGSPDEDMDDLIHTLVAVRLLKAISDHKFEVLG